MVLKRGDRGTIAGIEVVVTDVDSKGSVTVMPTGRRPLREVLPVVDFEPKSLDDFKAKHWGHDITTRTPAPDSGIRFTDYVCNQCRSTFRVL